jgi:DNA polymerase-3 subunit chi
LPNELPPEFSRVEEVIEIISTAAAVRLPARERFKFYRERGYTINARSVATGI